MQNCTQISRKNPAAFLFLVDQSESMGYVMPSINKPKAQHVANVINRTILNLIDLCNKVDGIRDYFHVGVICYSGDGVKNGISKNADDSILLPISEIANNVIGEEILVEKIDDGNGRAIEREVTFPIWVEAEATGETPMCLAFKKAKDALELWCRKNPNSYPPILINITDGDSTDGSPEGFAANIKNTGTIYGGISVFNIHVSSTAANVIRYPINDLEINDEYAKQLFRMSSVFPTFLAQKATQRGYDISENSRCFVFNADAADIVNFFEIGTLPAAQNLA